MKINELESLLDIPRANIRYYEKEGLLSPERSANGYRDYSDEDVIVLKKIILFRKIGFSITDIKGILSGEVSPAKVAEQKIAQLQNQIEELQGALEVCKVFKNEEVSFDESYYWELVHNKEKEGWKFADFAKDYLLYEQNLLVQTFENVFLYPLGTHIKNGDC